MLTSHTLLKIRTFIPEDTASYRNELKSFYIKKVSQENDVNKILKNQNLTGMGGFRVNFVLKVVNSSTSNEKDIE